MRAIGVILVILGLVGLAFGGFSWTTRKTVVDAGPIEITADKKESLPIAPLTGGLILVAGLVLVLRGGR